MVTTYNAKDMVAFGRYLLSAEREERLKHTDVEFPKGPSYEDRKRLVFEADLANWKDGQNEDPLPIEKGCSYPQALEAIKLGYFAIREYAYGRFVINKYPENQLTLTELAHSVRHEYIPSTNDQLAEDWIIIRDPYYFTDRLDQA